MTWPAPGGMRSVPPANQRRHPAVARSRAAAQSRVLRPTAPARRRTHGWQSRSTRRASVLRARSPGCRRHRPAHCRPRSAFPGASPAGAAVAGALGGKADPPPALRAFELDHQAVAGIALHIADHEARSLALAARKQVAQDSFELIEQAVAQVVLVMAALDVVGRVVE